MPKTTLAAALLAYQKSKEAIQAEPGVKYSYQNLQRLAKTKNQTAQNMGIDALLKSIKIAKRQQSFQAAQIEAKELCAAYESATFLTSYLALSKQYELFKRTYQNLNYEALVKANQQFQYDLKTTLQRQSALIFDAAFAALLAFAHSTADLRNRQPIKVAYQNLKQAMLHKDHLLTHQNTIILRNILTISTTTPLPSARPPSKPTSNPLKAQPSFGKGTPGLGAPSNSGETSPLYFMKTIN